MLKPPTNKFIIERKIPIWISHFETFTTFADRGLPGHQEFGGQQAHAQLPAGAAAGGPAGAAQLAQGSDQRPGSRRRQRQRDPVGRASSRRFGWPYHRFSRPGPPPRPVPRCRLLCAVHPAACQRPAVNGNRVYLRRERTVFYTPDTVGWVTDW